MDIKKSLSELLDGDGEKKKFTKVRTISVQLQNQWNDLLEEKKEIEKLAKSLEVRLQRIMAKKEIFISDVKEELDFYGDMKINDTDYDEVRIETEE